MRQARTCQAIIAATTPSRAITDAASGPLLTHGAPRSAPLILHCRATLPQTPEKGCRLRRIPHPGPWHREAQAWHMACIYREWHRSHFQQGDLRPVSRHGGV